VIWSRPVVGAELPEVAAQPCSLMSLMNFMTSGEIEMRIALLLVAVALFAISCSPEVGTKAWCEKMKEQPKGDWTANQANDYAQHCLFGPTGDE
jgi:hypothetical protein